MLELGQHLLPIWLSEILFGRETTCLFRFDGKPPSGNVLNGSNGDIFAPGIISVIFWHDPLESASANTFFSPGMCAMRTSTFASIIFDMTDWNMSRTFSTALCEANKSHTFEESEQIRIFLAPLCYGYMMLT